MIEAYERIRNVFGDIKGRLTGRWSCFSSGVAKERRAHSYNQRLVNTYTRVGTKLTVLEADIVAARDAVASARHDLAKLFAALLAAAKKYRDDQERQDEFALFKALAVGFAAAVGVFLVAAAPRTRSSSPEPRPGAGSSTCASEQSAVFGDSPETL